MIIFQEFNTAQYSVSFLDSLLVLSDDRYDTYLFVDGR